MSSSYVLTVKKNGEVQPPRWQVRICRVGGSTEIIGEGFTCMHAMQHAGEYLQSSETLEEWIQKRSSESNF